MPKLLIVLLSLIAAVLGLVLVINLDAVIQPIEYYVKQIQGEPLSRDARWHADLDYLYEQLQQRHPNPFYVTPKDEIDMAVAELHQSISSFSDMQVIAGFQKIVGLVHDAHTQLDLLTANPPIHFYPLQTYMFSDGLYVLDALSPYEKAIGAKVVSIEGNPIEEVYESYRQYISYENESRIMMVFPYRVRVAEILNALGFAAEPNASSWTFESADGEEFTLKINAIGYDQAPESFFPVTPIFDPSHEAPLYLTNAAENFWLEFLDSSNALYIQYNSVENKTQSGESITTFSRRIEELVNNRNPGRVIVDIRHNGGGDNTTYGPLLRVLTENPKINQKGKLFVLIGRTTFSAAVNFAVEVEFKSEAIFIGEESGNRPHMYGDCNRIKLPYSKLETCISSRFWPKGASKDDRLTLPPDVLIDVSFEEFINHRDPVLEAALNIDK